MGNNFYLSKRSLTHLKDVHKDMVRLVERALEITVVDFGVIEGVRTQSEQYQLVQSGASLTMNSRHLTGHAVDILAFLMGSGRWDWHLYVTIAKAFKKASEELGIPVRWGGCWKLLHEVDDVEEAVAEYVERKRKQGKRAFLDGGHYELSWEHYPVEKGKY